MSSLPPLLGEVWTPQDMVSQPIFFKCFTSFRKRTKKEEKKEKEERFLSERLHGCPWWHSFLKTNGVFAKIEPKPLIFNLVFCSGIQKVDFGERGRGRERVLIAAASIHINQPLTTVAVRRPRVHPPWPLIAISASNDAVSRVTCRWRQGPTGPNAEKVIAPSKPSPALSSGASIKTDGAHTLLDILYWLLFPLHTSFQRGIPYPTRNMS